MSDWYDDKEETFTQHSEVFLTVGLKFSQPLNSQFIREVNFIFSQIVPWDCGKLEGFSRISNRKIECINTNFSNFYIIYSTTFSWS